MYAHVIVGTDGSRTADLAVAIATSLARSLGAALTVASAWYREMKDGPVPSERVDYPADPAALAARWAEETSYAAAVTAREAGVQDARHVAPQGNAADALLRLAEERANSLLVVGSVGLSDRTERLVGNIPHQITHHAVRDVLIVATSRPVEHSWHRVALATDGSPTAALACAHGLELGRAVGAVPFLLTAAENHEDGELTLERAARDLPGAADLERRVAVGTHAADTLLGAASDYDLLVIGNKGMSGPSRLLGSVANDVTHHATTDLLLVNTTR